MQNSSTVYNHDIIISLETVEMSGADNVNNENLTFIGHKESKV